MPKVAVVEEVTTMVNPPVSPEGMDVLKVDAEFAGEYTAPFCLGPVRECFCCGSLCNKRHGCWYNCKQCCCDDLQVRTPWTTKPDEHHRHTNDEPDEPASRPTRAKTKFIHPQHPFYTQQLYWKSIFCMPCVMSEMVETSRMGGGFSTIAYFGFCVGFTQLFPMVGWTVASRQITDTVNKATGRFGVSQKVPWLCDRVDGECVPGTFWCPYCVIVRAQMEIRHRARAGIEVGHGIYRPYPAPHVMAMERESGLDENGKKKAPKYVGITEKEDPMPSQVRVEL